MQETMLAATLRAYGKPLEIGSLPRPKVGPGQLLLKLEASGVCHTDVHVWNGSLQPATNPNPFILGHEGVGRVAAIGQGVTGWRLDDRAGAAWIHNTCGVCDECVAQEESFCQTHQAHGFTVSGTFAEYVIVDAEFAPHLQDGDAALMAPLLCAGLTAYGALKRADLKDGETVAIFGCGGLGLYAVQLAHRMGATVIAIDRDPKKLVLAKAMGANLIAESVGENASAHVCINFAPTTATWNMMLAMVKPRGRVISAAMVPSPVQLNQEWLLSTGVCIMGTSVGTRAQMTELLSIHSERPLQAAVTRIRLEDVTMALKALEHGTATGRFCIEF